MIKYSFAKNQDGDLIDIKNVDRDKGFQFRCLCCDTEMIPKLGKVKVHHFAHKTTVECSGETYLHLLGKNLFYNHFLDCLKSKSPFYIELYHKRTCTHFQSKFGITCKLKKSLEKIDLTEYFTQIQMEQREGSFVPDLLLTSKIGKNKLFIEIAVSHFSSENKLSSDYRIIEISAESENDFLPIEQRLLSDRKRNITFKNFNPKHLNGSLCEGKCDTSFDLFFLYKNGKGKLFQKKLSQIESTLKRENNEISKYYITIDCGGYYPQKFKYFIAKSKQEGASVRNCFICQYHAKNKTLGYYDETRGNPIFCKFLRFTCHSNEAVECEYFRVDQGHIANLIQEGEYIINRSNIDKEGEEY